jgi:DNA-binding CsgD family transcriptional regulator
MELIEHFDPASFHSPERADESSGAVIVRLAERHNLDRAACLEIIDEVLEAFKSEDAQWPGGEDALRRIESKHRQAWHVLLSYMSNQHSAAEMMMAVRIMAMELGFQTVAGADSAAEIARMLGIKKQTVNKCVLNFQSKLGLPARAGQRNESARGNMSEARKEQLNHENRNGDQ